MRMQRSVSSLLRRMRSGNSEYIDSACEMWRMEKGLESLRASVKVLDWTLLCSPFVFVFISLSWFRE